MGQTAFRPFPPIPTGVRGTEISPDLRWPRKNAVAQSPSKSRGARDRTEGLDYALSFPTHSPQQDFNELRLAGAEVNPGGIRRVWLRHGIGPNSGTRSTKLSPTFSSIGFFAGRESIRCLVSADAEGAFSDQIRRIGRLFKRGRTC